MEFEKLKKDLKNKGWNFSDEQVSSMIRDIKYGNVSDFNIDANALINAGDKKALKHIEIDKTGCSFEEVYIELANKVANELANMLAQDIVDSSN